MNNNQKEKLKDLFGVDDLRNINSEMIYKHYSELQKDKNMSLALVKNLPNFADTMKGVIDITSNIIKENSKNNDFVNKGYYGELLQINNELSIPDLPFERRDILYNRWEKVMAEIKEQDLRNKKFLLKLGAWITGIGGVAIGGIIFAVKNLTKNDDDDLTNGDL